MLDLELRYIHHGISVFDMDESIEWYKNVFNAVVKMDFIHNFVNCRIVFMEAGGAVFELFEYLGDEKRPVPESRLESRRDLQTCGTKHVCYGINNMPQFFSEKVIPLKVEVDHGPEREGDNWMAFIKDNSGVLIELYDIGGAARDPDAFNDYNCKMD